MALNVTNLMSFEFDGNAEVRFTCPAAWWKEFVTVARERYTEQTGKDVPDSAIKHGLRDALEIYVAAFERVYHD